MAKWRDLQAHEWARPLLLYFFGRKLGATGPVRTLNVCPSTLAAAVGAPAADADAVRDAFVEVVKASAVRKDFLEAATDYHGYPDAPRSDEPPRFVVALLFTCLAASESTEEVQDEHSFMLRLRNLSGSHDPSSSLGKLPKLWRALESYLGRNPKLYRPLELPDPGGLTRIGHTIRLAFPDRRDQRALSELLDEEDLADAEPQIGPAIHVVCRHLNRFRSRFREAAQEFRALYDRVARHEESVECLLDHRLWSAIRDAAQRGRGAETSEDVETSPTLQLLADAQDDSLTLFVVTAGRESPAPGVFATQFPTPPYGPWRYALVDNEAQELAESTQSVVRRLLRSDLPQFGFSQHLRSNLLLFAPAQHGLLELVNADTVTEATVALVKDNIRRALVELPGFASARGVTSTYNGCSVLFDLKLRNLPSNDLKGTPLERYWLLHETLSKRPVRCVEGVQVDGGWMGYREVLPTIVSDGTKILQLTSEHDGRELLCKPAEGDRWTLPEQDFDGSWLATARGKPGYSASVRLSFYKAPSDGTYVPASTPEAWLVESVRGTRTLKTTDDRTPSAGSAPCETLLSARDFLGGGDQSNGKTAAPPATRIMEKARHGVFVRKRVMSEGELSARSLRLAAIVAGSAHRKAGMPFGDWRTLVRRIFRLSDDTQINHVTRAWQEHGLIDVAYSLRWRALMVFARPPSIVTHPRGSTICGAVAGLALSTTLDELSRAVGQSRQSSGISPFVPAPLLFQLGSEAEVAALAKKVQLPLRAAHPIRQPPEARPESEPVAYECIADKAWWSLMRSAIPAGASVRRWSRLDRPDYWTVSAKNEKFWSYSLNAAALWLCSRVSLSPFEEVGTHVLESVHAYLPLPMVRAAVELGALTCGPESPEAPMYSYRFATGTLRSELVALSAASQLDKNLSSPGASASGIKR